MVLPSAVIETQEFSSASIRTTKVPTLGADGCFAASSATRASGDNAGFLGVLPTPSIPVGPGAFERCPARSIWELTSAETGFCGRGTAAIGALAVAVPDGPAGAD